MLVGKLVALSVEKYYMALTKIQLKIYRFRSSLSLKGSRSLEQRVNLLKFQLYLCLCDFYGYETLHLIIMLSSINFKPWCTWINTKIILQVAFKIIQMVVFTIDENNFTFSYSGAQSATEKLTKPFDFPTLQFFMFI